MQVQDLELSPYQTLCYIKIKNGAPHNHPVTVANMQALLGPEFSLYNPPEPYKIFIRNDAPVLKPYQTFDDCGAENCDSWDHNGLTYDYDPVLDIYYDCWHIRDMTSEEKQAKINKIKADWAIFPNFTSWTFNEELCEFEPPQPRPSDGNEYFWSEPDLIWKQVPPVPDSGGPYRFDILQEAWIEVSEE